jgi:hypothetical protein
MSKALSRSNSHFSTLLSEDVPSHTIDGTYDKKQLERNVLNEKLQSGNRLFQLSTKRLNFKLSNVELLNMKASGHFFMAD